MNACMHALLLLINNNNNNKEDEEEIMMMMMVVIMMMMMIIRSGIIPFSLSGESIPLPAAIVSSSSLTSGMK